MYDHTEMILDRIVEAKRFEVSRLKEQTPLHVLEARIPDRELVSFAEVIQRPGINVIAEIKYRSPSHGPFLCQDPPEEIASRYIDSGAAAISVLTDEQFFGGSLRHLDQIAEFLRSEQDSDVDVPLLRKDFIIDRYQVVEARSAGASAYLLIAACLDRRKLIELQAVGRDYDMDPLVEVHNSYELDLAVESGAVIMGVNNRDLRTFDVDVKTSFELARRMEGHSDCLLVSESGIEDPVLVAELRDAGFSAFLIGTAFMDATDPGQRLRELLENL